MKDVSAVEEANAKKAIAAGIKVALSTDAAAYPHVYKNDSAPLKHEAQ
jgi:imidazolonepropionase-like amidohydrolase